MNALPIDDVLPEVVTTLREHPALVLEAPTGSGKTTLARAITGVWRTAGGKIRLDGAALDGHS